MSINKKSQSISLNDAEKRTLMIAARLESKHLSPYIRDIAMSHAKKVVADHEKNNATLDKKNLLKVAIDEVDAAIKKADEKAQDKLINSGNIKD